MTFDQKAYNKEYYRINKADIKAKKQSYYQLNKDKVKARYVRSARNLVK